MKSRPILFNSEMVRAILNGTKSQTRRFCKFQQTMMTNAEIMTQSKLDRAYRCPFGHTGNRLWVRETFNGDPSRGIGYAYRATQPEMDGCPWVPSIHMPRSASRITLEITAVRVERLNEISAADAKDEGLTALSKDGTLVKYGIPDRDGLPGNDDLGWHWQKWERDPRCAYRTLWESINGPGSWDMNPWVWVVEFKRVEK